MANSPTPPPPRRDDGESNLFSGGASGILAVTLATLALGVCAAGIAFVVAWLV